MRITSRGQVTIPKDIREKAGLLPETDVEFGIEGGVVTIRRSTHPGRGDRGTKLITHLRSFRDKVTMSTDEVMALTREE
jgi:AbrB family looped-hinge helix DNA binding protein